MTTSTFRTFRTPVRGHAFAPRPPETNGPTPGQLARLVREPDNPADPYAVGVWVADHQGRWRIGYLDRAVAARLAPRLDQGSPIAAQIEGWTSEPHGRWRRPVVVVLPSEPSERRTGGSSADHAAGSGDDAAARRPLWGRPPGVSRRAVHPQEG